jgi:hypothetical protein
MNHTIKGIIIVVAITSMLVLGATTMVPIMQNASARSTNTNTNTNSADSSSTSDATADNTNNINNSACTVTITCTEGSTSVTSSTTGTLRITKICPPGCSGTEFPITVIGNNPQPSSFSLKSGQGQDVKLGPGSFTVHETVPRKFTPRYSGDCKRTGSGSPDATGTISAEQNLLCTVVNHFLG